jgi:peptide/nickel transport system substrate-binding protein
MLMPTFSNWYDKSLSLQYSYRFDPQKAESLLEQVGFKKGPRGIMQSRSGKPLTLTVINAAANTDWVASLRVMQAGMRRAGIKLQIANLSSADYNTRLSTGRFELAYGGATNGPDPYYDYRGVLYSGNTAPVGKAAASNYERWRSPQTDRLLQEFAATTSPARQHAAIDGLQRIMLQQVPVIPVSEGVSWFQWSTARFTGWPTQSNPYADPAPYATPDWEVVLTTLRRR